MTDTIKKMYTIDAAGNRVNVRTVAEAVENASGQTLENVEAGAQVNIIETVKVNGTALTVTNKAVDITIDSETYTIAKKASANSGYLASYELKKGNTVIGDAINIPKDFLVKSGSVKICETAGTPSTIPALAAGDPYLDFVVNTKGNDEAETDEHIYANLKRLVDVYTAGNGITITNNQISVNTADTAIVDTAPAANSTKLVQSGGVYTALEGKQAAITSAAKLDADLVDDSTSTNKFVTAAEKQTYAGKQDAIADLSTIRSGAALGASALQPGANVSALTNDAGYLRYTEVLE